MIDPVTSYGMAEALAGISAGMTGQTLSDAYNDRMTNLIDVEGGPSIGYGNWTSNTPAISGDTSGSISTVPGQTPVDSWNDYVENEPGITVSQTTGGAVSGSGVRSVLYSLMEENPGTTQSVVKAIAPVAVPVTAAIAAISQAIGVSMNYIEVADEIKDNLINSVVGSGGIYDEARGLVTAWKDEWGRILFPKKVVEGIYDEILNSGIGAEGDNYTDEDFSSYIVMPVSTANTCSYITTMSQYNPPRQNLVSYEFNYPIFRVGNYLRAASQVPVTGSMTYIEHSTPLNYSGTETTRQLSATWYHSVFNGVDVYYTAAVATNWSPALSQSAPEAVTKASSSVTDSQAIMAAAGTIAYGTVSHGGYPEGTSESEATKYTPSTLPIAGNLATSYDEDTGILGTEPLVPIHITDEPYDTTGDTTDPTDPTADDNPAVAIPGEEITWLEEDPVTGEVEEKEGTVPLPLPIPDTRPSNPAIPLVNPSVIDSTLIDELVEELANTLDPQPGQSSGIIPVPPLPGITDPDTGQTTFPSIIPSSGPGFIHVYNPTPSEFVAFGTWLWVTYADATIDKILNNPFDGVIGAHELYATPNRDGRDNIRSAFLTCPTTADLVTNRYSEIDCGTVVVPEFYGNYLDYSPYSQAYIYLPFIGINEVSIDDIVGHAVNIRYRVDSYSGSCIAMIFVAKDGYQNLCYQFAGSCSVEVPMAGGSQAAIKAGMMQAEAYARAAMVSAGGHLLGGIGSALLGSLGGAISSVAGIAGDYANAKAGIEAARVANKSSVQHSGQFGASHGAMGQKVPFIIIRNPIQVKVVNYNDDYGFPAHKRVIIGGCTGYLRVREVNVISAHATDDEKAAIEALLKNGVYVS